MGVFSYLNLKRPANLLWKAFSPGRDLGEEKEEDGSEGTLNSSGGDISLASASGQTPSDTPIVRLKDIVKEETVKRDWFIRRGSEVRGHEQGGQERLVGGGRNFVSCLDPGQQLVIMRLKIFLRRTPGSESKVCLSHRSCSCEICLYAGHQVDDGVFLKDG